MRFIILIKDFNYNNNQKQRELIKVLKKKIYNFQRLDILCFFAQFSNLNFQINKNIELSSLDAKFKLYIYKILFVALKSQ